jgi:hypothetical protein
LYGCEIWSLTLREEHRLRKFENRVLRRISGPKTDDVTGEWRKLHNEELHMLYPSPDIIRQIKSMRMRWAGHVARMRDEREMYRVFVAKTKGTDYLEDRDVDGWDQNGSWGDWLGGVEWIQLAQVASCCECGDGLAGSGATKLVIPWYREYRADHVQLNRHVRRVQATCYGSLQQQAELWPISPREAKLIPTFHLKADAESLTRVSFWYCTNAPVPVITWIADRFRPSA